HRVMAGIHGDAEPAHVFRQLLEQGLVHVAGVTMDAMVERLMRAWRSEPGHTVTAVVNAVTRAAHAEPWSSVWAETELAEQGGASALVGAGRRGDVARRSVTADGRHTGRRWRSGPA